MLNSHVFTAIYIAIVIVSIYRCFSKDTIIIAGLSKEKSDTVFFLFLSLLIAVLASIRPNTMPDFQSYESAYLLDYNFFDFSNELQKYGTRVSGIEVLFLAFMGALKSIGLTFRQVLFVIAFINSVLIMCSCRDLVKTYLNKEPNTKFIRAMFLSLFGYHYCCIAIRAGLGIGIGLLAIVLLTQKSNIKRGIGVVAFIIACLLHSMSVLLIIPTIILLLKSDKLAATKRWLIITGVAAIASLVFNIGSLVTRGIVSLFVSLTTRFGVAGFSGYVNSLDMAVGKRDWLIVISTLIVLYHFRDTQTLVSKKLLLIVSVGILITAFLYPIRAINRAADYFYIFLLPLVSTVNVDSKEKVKTPYALGVSSIMYLLFMITL